MKTSLQWRMIVPLLAAGCYTGAVQDDSGPTTDDSEASSSETLGNDSDDTDDDGNPDALSCDTPSPGLSPLRRLTRAEYNNTVRDLLGDDSNPASKLPAEEKVLGFENNAEALSVSLLLAEGYENLAEELAQAAVTDLPALLNCDVGTLGEDACAAQFIPTFGRRVYRRPLSPGEVARFIAFFEGERALYTFSVAIKQVVKAMLTSPHFLYRVEFGMPDPNAAGALRLNGYETATRLAYLLWNTTPDDALLDAAEAGELATSSQIGARAEAMLADPRGRASVANFQRQWLELDPLDAATKDPEAYPDFYDELKPLMRREIELFWEAVVFGEDSSGSLHELYTANYTFLNPELAAYYQVPFPWENEFRSVQLDASAHAGILTKGGLIAAHSSPNQTNPVRRGLFVRERLLCNLLPPPPPDIDIIPPEPDPNATTRERFEQHTSDPTCQGCHILIDDLGFGFEHYDGAGRWRATENGFPVDASGDLVGTPDANGPFNGVPELAARLAGSEAVRGCFVKQWFRYAYGRVETKEDACSIDLLEQELVATDDNIRALLVALTQTDSFLYRSSY